MTFEFENEWVLTTNVSLFNPNFEHHHIDNDNFSKEIRIPKYLKIYFIVQENLKQILVFPTWTKQKEKRLIHHFQGELSILFVSIKFWVIWIPQP